MSHKDSVQQFNPIVEEMLKHIDAIAYVTDINTYEILHINSFTKNLFGNITGQICWKSLWGEESGPCSCCNGSAIHDNKGLCKTHIHHTLNKRYAISSYALQWIDGRSVSLQIAAETTDKAVKKSDKAISNRQKQPHFEIQNQDEPFKAVKKVSPTEKKMLEYQKQLQTLSSEISLIEEREKRRIAIELHDCIGQTLALAKIKLGLLTKVNASADFKNDVTEVLRLIEQTIRETRTLTFELSPPILYELGLKQAIKWLADKFQKDHGLTVSLHDKGFRKSFDNYSDFFLFQSARELLVNIIKHSQAKNVDIILMENENSQQIIFRDDGKGFARNAEANPGYGLFTVKERMHHLNGKMDIKSKKGKGSEVILSIPAATEKT
ncbi:MAG: sensor histidine kinase [Nitrospira sp.]|nr:sensor histidine kinase [bacterium]MBL7049627.1 sensor histidine kinase [Nitrospira sp.]